MTKKLNEMFDLPESNEPLITEQVEQPAVTPVMNLQEKHLDRVVIPPLDTMVCMILHSRWLELIPKSYN